LLTGGAGFIGSHTADLLLEKGYEVTIIDNLQRPVHPTGKLPEYVSRNATFIRGDVRRRRDLEQALEDVDGVFHLAAQQDYLPNFSKFANTNDLGTALLYEVIVRRRLKVKVVLASSQAVYGEGKYQCPRHGITSANPRAIEQLLGGDWDLKCPTCSEAMRPLATDEETQPKPTNHYGVSKISQELWALTLGRRYEIPTTVLRYSITQGPRQSPHNAYSGILRVFATRLIANQQPVIFEDGMQLRDYVHIDELVKANLISFENTKAEYQILNVGGTRPHSVLEYYNLIAHELQTGIEPLITGQFRVGDVRHIFSNSDKIGALGWRPSKDIREITHDYVGWLKKLKNIPDHYLKAERRMKRNGVILRKIEKELMV